MSVSRNGKTVLAGFFAATFSGLLYAMIPDGPTTKSWDEAWNDSQHPAAITSSASGALSGALAANPIVWEESDSIGLSTDKPGLLLIFR